MLHPAIEVRSKGTIHNNGLFATQPIRKGALIWELDEPTFTWKEIETWTQERLRDFRWYGFQCGIDRYSLPEGMSREMNHSCDPNTWSKGSDILIARHDILTGEEITYDYSTFEVDIPFESECHCGSPCCRGTISNRDYLDPGWQKQYGSNLPPHVLVAIEIAHQPSIAKT
ncbi:MAG: SET domain-containing protein-lysine N-methyltransferase [Gammaproteobacteria bacterium]|nr:SET domain-containing protein-lysine N-methyltransferase [Gammaproteobacteria bacterium]